MCNITDEWLSFFHDYEQILWKVEPSLIDSENLTIDVSDNNIDNVNGLSNITSITGSVWLNDNEQLLLLMS